MPSQRNIHQLADLKDKISRTKSLVLTDHSGLKVSQQQQLRELTRQVGGEFMVAKNTLLSLALGPGSESGTDDKEQVVNGLQGPTSILFSYQDEMLPLKVLAKFSQEHDKPIIKAGFFGGKPLSADEVKELAMLPGLAELMAQLIRKLQGPMYGFAGVLQGNLRKFICVLNAIKDKRTDS